MRTRSVHHKKYLNVINSQIVTCNVTQKGNEENEENEPEENEPVGCVTP
jgi:hypothetical protein